MIQSPEYEVDDVNRLISAGWTREVVVVVTGERGGVGVGWGGRHSELAPDPLSSRPIFLKELTRAAFLDGWCRNIDRDTLILLIQARVNRRL